MQQAPPLAWAAMVVRLPPLALAAMAPRHRATGPSPAIPATAARTPRWRPVTAPPLPVPPAPTAIRPRRRLAIRATTAPPPMAARARLAIRPRRPTGWATARCPPDTHLIPCAKHFFRNPGYMVGVADPH